VGNALYKNGYRMKIFYTINFSKSMHYNPFAYLHSEKDILKLVPTLIANTKGESKDMRSSMESIPQSVGKNRNVSSGSVHLERILQKKI
jgi:hypothetical protein